MPIPFTKLAVTYTEALAQAHRALGIHVFLGRRPSRHGAGRRERYSSEYLRGRAAKAAAFVVTTRCLPTRARLLVTVIWQVRSDFRAGFGACAMPCTLAIHDMHARMP